MNEIVKVDKVEDVEFEDVKSVPVVENKPDAFANVDAVLGNWEVLNEQLNGNSGYVDNAPTTAELGKKLVEDTKEVAKKTGSAFYNFIKDFVGKKP